MAFIGNTPEHIQRSSNKFYKYVATSGQTVFSGADANGETLDITSTQILDVYLNGIRLIKTDDYTQDTDELTLTVGATTSDELVIRTEATFVNAEHVLKSSTRLPITKYDGSVVRLSIASGGYITIIDNSGSTVNVDLVV